MEAREELWDVLSQLPISKDHRMKSTWCSECSKNAEDIMPKKQGIVSYFGGGQQYGHEEMKPIIQIQPCDDTLGNDVNLNR